MNITTIKNAVTSRAARQVLVLSKHSPKILFVSGVVGVGATVVMASKATLKVEEVIDEAEGRFAMINKALEAGRGYDDNDALKDRVATVVQAGVKLTRLYGPALLVGSLSIGCLTGAHNILSNRNAALMTAYAGLDKAFTEYRKRVVSEVGEDRERQLRFNESAGEAAKIAEANNLKPKKGEALNIVNGDPSKHSPYARFFDQTCQDFSPVPEYNLMKLRAVQEYFTNMLHARGHVFLNEVYDALDIPRSKAGAVVGWVLGEGDDYVDFGIYRGSDGSRDFVNGNEGAILLDFNVAGVVYDKI